MMALPNLSRTDLSAPIPALPHNAFLPLTEFTIPIWFPCGPLLGAKKAIQNEGIAFSSSQVGVQRTVGST